ncbi:uncharacterized protein LOC142355667 [Convolutriloba macropyga]|uniref:uncharacterized protein LOC142355667 n=1 Tax=Convolutriloba macropyga TaxID=536237 RepID=UPI003F51B7BE
MSRGASGIDGSEFQSGSDGGQLNAHQAQMGFNVSNGGSGGGLGVLFEQYGHELGVLESIQSIVNPLLALVSMLINLYIARFVIMSPALHKFTYIMVAYQVKYDQCLIFT